MNTTMIELHPWTGQDLPLLHQANTAAMTRFLGGPESEAKILDRQRRYLDSTDPRSGIMYSVRLPGGEAAGSIGYWETGQEDDRVYETGWFILPEHQGKGLAVLATRAVIERASAAEHHRFLHAFPRIDNSASNAVCRSSGFTLKGEIAHDYPKGNPIRCNNWCLDLRSPSAS